MPVPAAVVDEDAVTFVLADPNRRLAAARLVDEVGLADTRFVRHRTTWSLRVARPPVDRLEYLFEVEDANGRRHTMTDPANPRRAPGAFGEKSEITFPGYAPPGWLDTAGVSGTEEPFEFDAPLLDGTVSGSVWTPDGLSGPAPLLVVHDGPEFAALGGLMRYVTASIAAELLPPTRVALLAPGERNTWYSADPHYARTVAEVVLPALPGSTARIGLGVSLGALAMLHLHRRHPSALDGLFLQSGSFFTPDLDGQEADFSGWAPVTAFVRSVHESTQDEHPIPVAMTCGLAEENLANNRRMRDTLQRLGYPATFAPVRDSHNYTAWRDALHPHLTALVSATEARHAP